MFGDVKRFWAAFCASVMFLSSFATSGELVREAIPDVALFDLADVARKTLEEQRGGPDVVLPRPPSGDPRAQNCGVRVVYLENGRQISSGWANQASIMQNARLAAMRALKEKSPAKDAVVACLVELALPLRQMPGNAFFAAKKIDAGRQGLRLSLGDKEFWIYASDCLLKGKGVPMLMDAACATLGATPQDVADNKLKFEIYDAVTVLSPSEGQPVRLYRNGTLFTIAQMDRAAVDAAILRARQWYIANQEQDGTFPYVYNPQSDFASDDGENQLRQIFNIAALGMLYRANKDAEIRAAGIKALDIIMKDYVDNPEKPWGYIKDGNEAKLGAAAGALCAIVRLDLLDTKGRQAERLASFLDAMRQDDGHYLTYYLPDGKEGGEEYYPGEAQLALMEWHEARKDSWAMSGVARSLEFYKQFFGKSFSMPMVPWHTQAYVKLHRAKPSPAIADFVFRMNDLLVTAQQRGSDIPEDHRGEVLNPQKRGSAHVSGTGVYVEGLADALGLARELGDSPRIDRYRTTLIWAMRNLIQLQVKDGGDSWCMPNAAKAMGGFRSSVENSDIRIDNMQHCICALIKARAVLTDADYRDVAEAAAKEKR